MRTYGVGVLGNCCTHGAGLCSMLERRPDTRVVAAHEADPRRAAELQDVFGGTLAASLEEVIGHPDVEIVAVACDPCDKADVVEASAAAGVHILLNKPMCDSLDNARRIVEAVRRHGVQCVHDIPMVRTVPACARLMADVRSREYGRVLNYHHLFGMNFAPDFDLEGLWPERLGPAAKSGGGEMTNMGCYAIDYAVALFGRPGTVTAKWQQTWDVYREPNVENFGQLVLDYGEFFAFLGVGKRQMVGEYRHSNAITVDFEQRTVYVDSNAEMVTVNHVPWDYERFAAGLVPMDSVDQLIRAIEDGAPPMSDVDTGMLGVETLMAAYRSILVRGPVALPLASGSNPL